MGPRSRPPTGSCPDTPKKPLLRIDCEVWNASPTNSRDREASKRLAVDAQDKISIKAENGSESTASSPRSYTSDCSVSTALTRASDIPSCRFFDSAELPGLGNVVVRSPENATHQVLRLEKTVEPVHSMAANDKPRSRFLKENIIPQRFPSNRPLEPTDSHFKPRATRMHELLKDSYPESDTASDSQAYSTDGPGSCSTWAQRAASRFRYEQEHALQKYGCKPSHSRIYGQEKEHSFLHTATSRPITGYVMPPPYESHSDSPLYSPTPRRMRALEMDMTGLYH